MQDRHDRDLKEFVMLGPAFQTSWVMEDQHDKFTFFQTQTLLRLIRKVLQRSENFPRDDIKVKNPPTPYQNGIL